VETAWRTRSSAAVWAARGREGSAMESNTAAYRTLVERVRELDGAVLTPHEAQQVRDAADARLFGDGDQVETVRNALELLDRLVEAARLSTRTCGQLSDLLCGIEPVRVGS
jgi:hypothetical protein